MSTISTFFKATKASRQLDFGLKNTKNFNYFEIDREGTNSNLMNNMGNLFKQMEDSYRLDINLDDKYKGNIKELKLTNQNIFTWEDYWIDDRKRLIDPKIENLNLQKNDLIHANFNLTREHLRSVNLEGNLDLEAVF
jgi:hypothetical protein